MQILWHFPQTQNKSFKPQYDRIQWINNKEDFVADQEELGLFVYKGVVYQFILVLAGLIGLVGGASLDAEAFGSICESARAQMSKS